MMSEIIKFECFCGQPIEVNSDAAGQKFKCPSCGTDLVVPGNKKKETVKISQPPPLPSPIPLPAPTKEKGSSFFSRGFGILILIIGIFVTFSSLNMDTSISTGDGFRVNNLGLMADRQNGLILGVGMAIAGIIILEFSHKKS